MSLTLSSANLAVLDENWTLPSKTSELDNKDVKVDFNGRNAVTIRNWDTVSEVDYVRFGTDRFGTMNELGGGTQTLTLSQHKAATWSIDHANLIDTDNTAEASTTIDRQLREVAIPNKDIYNLAIISAYAIANSQSSLANAISSADAYSDFLAQCAALTDAIVPEEGRICYMKEAVYNFLRLDTAFTKACNDAYADLKSGVRTMVNGVKIIIVPLSYLPANTGYLFTHAKAHKSVSKVEMARVLDNQRGIHGSVCEYDRYHDFFVLNNKGVALRVQTTA
jgi:hypothetical protein